MKTKSEIELEKRVAELVQELALSGLKARACEQTNEALDIDRKKLEAEVRRLQEQLSRKSPWPEGCHGHGHAPELPRQMTAEDELKFFAPGSPTPLGMSENEAAIRRQNVALQLEQSKARVSGDTLTSVIWPRTGLTPEQFAEFGGMEHEAEAARECGHDTNKYWQEKYVEAKRLYELQMRTASEQVASLQKKLENARGSADGWVADIESSLGHWKEYAGKLESQLKVATSEASDLRTWKEGALLVMKKTEIQEIGKELELPLGTDIPPNILPGIRALKAKLENYRHIARSHGLIGSSHEEHVAAIRDSEFLEQLQALRLENDDLRSKLEGARARASQESEEQVDAVNTLREIARTAKKFL